MLPARRIGKIQLKCFCIVNVNACYPHEELGKFNLSVCFVNVYACYLHEKMGKFIMEHNTEIVVGDP